MKHVLVIFHARDEAMEELALGAAFGVSEAGATIRLRHLRFVSASRCNDRREWSSRGQELRVGQLGTHDVGR